MIPCVLRVNAVPGENDDCGYAGAQFLSRITECVWLITSACASWHW